ncbi:MAG: cbb3-type cytochrome oxidase assembly protein CcoS [Hyphomicrobiales bacterium]|nr:cbb3-type cytochrome oxidase assembly protein CcoS [Hyphomicrobiales bacterium]
MAVLIFLIPIAIGLGLAGLFAFMWTLKSGQYDDLEGAKWRILADDDLPAGKSPCDGAKDAAAPAKDA